MHPPDPAPGCAPSHEGSRTPPVGHLPTHQRRAALPDHQPHTVRRPARQQPRPTEKHPGGPERTYAKARASAVGHHSIAIRAGLRDRLAIVAIADLLRTAKTPARASHRHPQASREQLRPLRDRITASVHHETRRVEHLILAWIRPRNRPQRDRTPIARINPSPHRLAPRRRRQVDRHSRPGNINRGARIGPLALNRNEHLRRTPRITNSRGGQSNRDC
jgi:hypothetical protein